MQRKLMGLLLVTVAIGGTVLYLASRVHATPANAGFTSSTLSLGRFDEFEVFNHFVSPNSTPHEDHRRNVWLSLQKTKGSSDVYVQTNTWAPGGSTGWHTHPGHSLITVTAGTVTAYEGERRRSSGADDCRPAHSSRSTAPDRRPGPGELPLLGRRLLSKRRRFHDDSKATQRD